ncbi:hypothetical protein QBC37DRAFT_124726 [Rhypophila decipiens]|uniref:Secreted protein n=1 Tax=Rhypophila decipiens TaxID=261697 RepID=A0AAN6YFU2_9PEZI|nr:hypothetical protein QBC37DRAFT_124726 [Rhypophila decipiens]
MRHFIFLFSLITWHLLLVLVSPGQSRASAIQAVMGEEFLSCPSPHLSYRHPGERSANGDWLPSSAHPLLINSLALGP